MAIHAGGGWLARTAFLGLGIFLIYFTARGLLAIKAGDLPRHRAWMVRSYAIVLAALSFRVFHWAVFPLSLGPNASYALAVWLSLGTSLIHGHAWALRLRPLGEKS